MKIVYLIIAYSLINCASDEVKRTFPLKDSSYEMKFSPCTCKRTEMVVQAKQSIMNQGIKDYEEFTAINVEPELESEILENEYENFLYDFSLLENKKENSPEDIESITATGKVNQQELNNFIETNSKPNRRKPINSSPEYGSKGLEAIKSFKSDRKKRQTVKEISNSKTILPFEINKK